jgi:death-on-curing protein
MKPSFLTLDEVLAIHSHLIERYGGTPGIRDVGLLESALAMPEVRYAGQWLHPSLHEMAAAYCYHLVESHPFLDGNKRVGLAVALVFLSLNGQRVVASDDALVELILGVVDGTKGKADLAVFFGARAERRD